MAIPTEPPADWDRLHEQTRDTSHQAARNAAKCTQHEFIYDSVVGRLNQEPGAGVQTYPPGHARDKWVKFLDDPKAPAAIQQQLGRNLTFTRTGFSFSARPAKVAA